MIFHDASLEMVNVSEIFYFWSNTWIQIELESPIQWSQARQESGVLVELHPETVLCVFFFHIPFTIAQNTEEIADGWLLKVTNCIYDSADH
jgi:hypothetical protein